MRFVAMSTIPVADINKQPVGTVAYLFLEPGASASRVQSALSDRARNAGVRIATKCLLLVDQEESSVTKAVRVEVLGEQ